MKRQLVLLISIIVVASLWHPAKSTAQNSDNARLFITDDGAFSVWLPEGWYASGDREGGVFIVQDEDGLDVPERVAELEIGQFSLSVFLVSDTVQSLFGITNADDSHLVMDELLNFYEERDDDTVEILPITDRDFAGRTFVTMTVRQDIYEDMFFTWYVAPDTVAIGRIGDGLGTLNEFGKEVAEMMTTVRYALPLDQTYQKDNLVFQYPVEWIVEETLPDTAFAVTNTVEAIEVDELSPGQYGVVILDVSILDASGDVVEVAAGVGDAVQEFNQEISEAQLLNINGIDIGFVEIRATDGQANEGGIFVIETERGLMGAIYVAAYGDAHQVELTGLNILLSIE